MTWLSSLNRWRNCMRSWSSARLTWKGLRVNMRKAKVLISGPGLEMLQKSGKDPVPFVLKGVGTKSLSCGGCSNWAHKRCSGMYLFYLKPDPSFGCKRCTALWKQVFELKHHSKHFVCICKPVLLFASFKKSRFLKSTPKHVYDSTGQTSRWQTDDRAHSG